MAGSDGGHMVIEGGIQSLEFRAFGVLGFGAFGLRFFIAL